MNKKLLVLVMVISVIAIHQSISTEPASARRTAPLKKTAAPLKRVDPFKFEYVSGPMNCLPNSLFMLSVLNSSEKRDEYVQVELHIAFEPGNPNAPDPKKVENTKTIKLKPGTIFTLNHYSRDERMIGYDFEYWFKIKASSEFLIPKVVMHYIPDAKKVSTIKAMYLPGDFAVFSRDPHKRIR